MKVYFVGAGPGNKDLLTIRAHQLLSEADIIIYPGSLIEKDILNEYRGEKINSHGRSLEELSKIIIKAIKNGKKVVRLQSGDPSIYGAIKEQMEMLEKEGIEVEVVPGVSSMFAASAALKAELTLPGVTQSVVLTRPEGKTLDEDEIEVFSKTSATLVIFLGVHRIDDVVKKVKRDPETPVAVVYHASRDDQKIIRGTLKDISVKVKKVGIRKTAIIIIGDVLKGNYRRSVLYSGKQ